MSSHHVTIQKIDGDSLEEVETEEATDAFEGGQANVDELKEIN